MPSRFASASRYVESADEPPPMLSPTSISTIGPSRRGVGVLERLGHARGRRPGAPRAAPRPARASQRAASRAAAGIAVVDRQERHPHLFDVGVRVALGDAGREHARAAPAPRGCPRPGRCIGSSPVYCLTMLTTSGGISSAWTGRISPLMRPHDQLGALLGALLRRQGAGWCGRPP